MSAAIYEFGPFRLDLAERVLLRAGVVVPLQRKAFETLLLLVTQSGRVVEKDEFLRTIWSESFVEEGSLTVNISILRKTLGDDQNGQKFIETVPRRGYRFVAPIRVVTAPALAEVGFASSEPIRTPTEVAPPVPRPILPAPSPKPSHRPYYVFALLAAVSIGLLVYRFRPVAPRTIAVLPFVNQKPDPETNFLGYALANVIAAKLSSVRTPGLMPISTVYRPTNQTPDPQQASEQLNVDLLLHGTYLREDGNLRVTASLIEIPSRHEVWQDTFDLKDDKLMLLQEQVARRVIVALHLNLTDAQRKLMEADVPRDPVAYEYYLRGIEHYSQERINEAIELLEKSVALDKQYARAWEYLGSAYAVRGSTRFGGSEYYQKAQRAFDEAIKLNPNEPRPHVFRADLFIETNRVEEAVPILQDVLARHPQHALAAWELSYACRYAGLLDESIKWGERALDSDPSFKLTSAVFISYLYTQQYQKFLKSLTTVNDTPYIMFYRGFAYYHLQNFEQARAAFDQAYQKDATLLQTRIGKALSYGLAGETQAGLALLAQIEQEVTTREVTDAEGVYKIAQSYAMLGDKAGAVRMLRRSVEGGFFCSPYLQKDPLLESLHGETEFGQLLAMARQRYETFKRTFANKL